MKYEVYFKYICIWNAYGDKCVHKAFAEIFTFASIVEIAIRHLIHMEYLTATCASRRSTHSAETFDSTQQTYSSGVRSIRDIFLQPSAKFSCQPRFVPVCARACQVRNNFLGHKQWQSTTLVWAAVSVTRIDGGQRGGLAEPLPTGTARTSRRGELANSDQIRGTPPRRIHSKPYRERQMSRPSASAASTMLCGNCKHKQLFNKMMMQ